MHKDGIPAAQRSYAATHGGPASMHYLIANLRLVCVHGFRLSVFKSTASLNLVCSVNRVMWNFPKKESTPL